MHKSFKGEVRASCTDFPSMWKRDLAASSGSGEVVSEDTKPNLWAPLATISPEHFRGFPLQVSRRLSERDILLLSDSFLICLSVACARSILGHLAMNPAVRLVRNLCQHEQIVSAERPRRLPVAGLVPVRPRECHGVPGPLV